MRAIRAVAAVAAFTLGTGGARTQSAALTRRDLEGQTTEQLLALAQLLRTHAEPLLVAPPRELRITREKYLASPDAGVARLLRRGRFEHLIEKRGGGAYYSFATRLNDYDREPDIELDDRTLQTSFYGGTTGILIDIGETDAESPPLTEKSKPVDVLDDVWSVLWKDLTKANDRASEFDALCRGGRLTGRASAVVGHTYLLRAILTNEHDHLVEFTIVDEDQRGPILVWRILRTWPMAKQGHPYRPEAMDWGQPPAALAARLKDMPLELMVASADALRASIDQRLLTAPAPAKGTPAHALVAAGARLARLTPRFRFVQVLEAGEWGGYFSFALGTHHFQQAPDLGCESIRAPGQDPAAWSAHLSAAGMAGAWIADAGEAPLMAIDVKAAKGPGGVDDATWKFLCQAVTDDERKELATDGRLTTRATLAGKLRVPTSVDGSIGRTYVLRSANYGHADSLVAFTIVDIDRLGMTIAWRTLHGAKLVRTD